MIYLQLKSFYQILDFTEENNSKSGAKKGVKENEKEESTGYRKDEVLGPISVDPRKGNECLNW